MVLEGVVDLSNTGVGNKGDFLGGWECLGLDVLEYAVDGPVMKLLVEYGLVITVFVVNTHGMKAFCTEWSCNECFCE